MTTDKKTPDERMEELIAKLKEAGIPYEQSVHMVYEDMISKASFPVFLNGFVSKIHLKVYDVSIITGAVSFDRYDLMGGGFDSDRFDTAEEVVEALKHCCKSGEEHVKGIGEHWERTIE